MQHVDHIIVGHGLAGAALAFEFERHGHTVAVIDRGEPVTSSKVAAGLMTPITGKRFALTPRWDELWPAAIEFYEAIEAQTQSRFLTRGPAVRLFRNAAEREWFEKRQGMLAHLVEPPTASVSQTWLSNEFGSIQMRDAGRLDVAGMLEARAARLGTMLYRESLEDADIQLGDHGVSIQKYDLVAGQLTFCEGFSVAGNSWFPQIRFEAAKGEMLVIRCTGLNENRTIHANGLWLAPLGDDLYRVGATYDWDNLDCVPTDAARESLLERIAEFLLVSFDVIEHLAAVRPIVNGRQPVIGINNPYGNIGYINGLGSKGALLAPSVARMYANSVAGIGDIDPEFCLHRRFGSKS